MVKHRTPRGSRQLPKGPPSRGATPAVLRAEAKAPPREIESVAEVLAPGHAASVHEALLESVSPNSIATHPGAPEPEPQGVPVLEAVPVPRG